VRQAAQDILSKVLVRTEPSHVADVICFTVSHWSSWKRIEISNRKTLLDRLSNKEIANQIKLKLLNSTSGPLSVIMSELGRVELLDNCLEKIATDAIQPSLRAKAYRSLFTGNISWLEGRKWIWTDRGYNEGRMQPVFGTRVLTKKIHFLPILHSAASDRSSLVRRVAAEFLIKELDSLGCESSSLAKQLSSDRSSAVAERGKFALKKLAGETLF